MTNLFGNRCARSSRGDRSAVLELVSSDVASAAAGTDDSIAEAAPLFGNRSARSSLGESNGVLELASKESA